MNDERTSSVPDDGPPELSAEWESEIQRRSDEIDAELVATEDWAMIRERLFAKLGIWHMN